MTDFSILTAETLGHGEKDLFEQFEFIHHYNILENVLDIFLVSTP
jgi:hypothetical protein